jgi:hypothetical protein
MFEDINNIVSKKSNKKESLDISQFSTFKEVHVSGLTRLGSSSKKEQLLES